MARRITHWSNRLGLGNPSQIRTVAKHGTLGLVLCGGVVFARRGVVGIGVLVASGGATFAHWTLGLAVIGEVYSMIRLFHRLEAHQDRYGIPALDPARRSSNRCRLTHTDPQASLLPVTERSTDVTTRSCLVGVLAPRWMIVTVPRTVRNQFRRRIGSLFFCVLGIFFGWLAFRGAEVIFLWTHYRATVGQCFGGRNNLCNVRIRTGYGLVTSRAYLGAVHSGQHVLIAAAGHPPWRSVQAASGGLGSGWFVFILASVAAPLFLAAGVYGFVRPAGSRIRHGYDNLSPDDTDIDVLPVNPTDRRAPRHQA